MSASYGFQKMKWSPQCLPDLLWLNCWCEWMWYVRGVWANYVNRMFPVVILRNILFAKVTRSHFVNNIKPRVTTQLADQHWHCEIQPISWWYHIFYMLLCSNVSICYSHKFKSADEWISYRFPLMYLWEHLQGRVALLVICISLSHSTTLPSLQITHVLTLCYRAFRPFLNSHALSSLTPSRASPLSTLSPNRKQTSGQHESCFSVDAFMRHF